MVDHKLTVAVIVSFTYATVNVSICDQ